MEGAVQILCEEVRLRANGDVEVELGGGGGEGGEDKHSLGVRNFKTNNNATENYIF